MKLTHESGRPLSLLELRAIAIPLILGGHTATSIMGQFDITKRTAERWIAKATESSNTATEILSPKM